MAVVFFHIPRTSGSTVWHTLAKLAPASGVETFDLFHRSQQLFGSPYFSIDAVEDLRPKIAANGAGAIVHHHTRQNITAALCPEQNKYVTILRDPAERLISETFHLSAILRGKRNDVADYTRYLYELFSRDFLSRLADPATPPDELVTRAAAEPFYRNYYINSFWQLLFGDARREAPPLQQVPETVLPALAFAVANRFHFIGQFPRVDDSIKEIAGLAGIRTPPEVELVHVANGSRIPPLRPETIALVREFNQADYKFIRRAIAQHETGLARRLAQTEARLPYLEVTETELTARLAAAELRSSLLEQKLAAFRQSKSWRWTRPLRNIRGLGLRIKPSLR